MIFDVRYTYVPHLIFLLLIALCAVCCVLFAVVSYAVCALCAVHIAQAFNMYIAMSFSFRLASSTISFHLFQLEFRSFFFSFFFLLYCEVCKYECLPVRIPSGLFFSVLIINTRKNVTAVP